MARSLASVAVLAGVLALVGAGCGGGDNQAAPPATPTTTETTTTDTSPTTTGATNDAAKGAQVFSSAGCGGCHTFSKADSNGSIGPNLDDLSPSYDAVLQQVTNGGGGMPAFKDQLTEQQIRDVAAFVSGQSS